jgi:membrane protein YqaA with SNARE-associated domain
LYHAEDAYVELKNWFESYGVWVILLAGVTPIPYKLFTITAGVMSMAIAPFIILSILGRGARFFLVAACIYFGGKRLEEVLRRYIDFIGWAVVFIVVLFSLVIFL